MYFNRLLVSLKKRFDQVVFTGCHVGCTKLTHFCLKANAGKKQKQKHFYEVRSLQEGACLVNFYQKGFLEFSTL